MEKIYEKTYFTIVVSIIFLCIIALFMKELLSNKIFLYEKYQSTVVKDNLVMLLVSKEELKTIYKNKYLYLENKKIKFKVRKIEENILSRNKVNYHALYLEIKLKKNSKENDVVSFSVIEDKISFIDIIKNNWKGDKSEED